MTWKPDYSEEFTKRANRLAKINADPILAVGAKEYYRDKPAEWIVDWACTYDPRNASRGLPTLMPFILFPRQKEFVQFLAECLDNEQSGLIEKARDVGATWVCAAFSVWIWTYKAGGSVGFGSRKEMLVDKIGNPDSIFEKIRMIIKNLPLFLKPKGFDAEKHATFMRIINPENGSTITGEAGDNIGRGGRKLIFFKDESSHYERPQLIEAALGDNTNVQIDISSVNGLGNMFHMRREAGVEWTPTSGVVRGKTQVFIFDWRDHPAKTQEWYDEREAKAKSEGMIHLFRQEVDRSYTGAIENLVIPQEWVRAAIDADKKLGFKISGRTYAGLDVADEGGDKNALAIRKGVNLEHVNAWGEGDTYETAERSLSVCKMHKVTQIAYDCIGVGAGVKAAFNRLPVEGISILPWNAGATPLYPDRHLIKTDRQSPLNKDFFSNLKAQAWWSLRDRFHKTYRAVKEGVHVAEDELINLPGDLDCLKELCKELSQPTFNHDGRGKSHIDKKPEGTKSTNLADAVVMAFWQKEGAMFFSG